MPGRVTEEAPPDVVFSKFAKPLTEDELALVREAISDVRTRVVTGELGSWQFEAFGRVTMRYTDLLVLEPGACSFAVDSGTKIVTVTPNRDHNQ